MVDHFGTAGALKDNVSLEYQRNRERYEFLRWGAQAFENFRVVPPGTGICHQSIWSIWQKQSGPAKNAKMAKWLRLPIPTRWWAPTATQPW